MRFIDIFNLSTPFSFTTLRRFLQETTFENIVANGGIAYYEQFLILPPRFKLYAKLVLSVKESFHIIFYIPSMSSVVDLMYVGNGKIIKSYILTF